MQVLQRATSSTRRNENLRAIRKLQLLRRIGIRWPELVLEPVRKIVPRELHLVIEEFFRVLLSVRDNAGRLVCLKENLIEIQDTEEGRHAELPGFKNDTEEPEILHDNFLGPVWFEEHLGPILILDVIEIADAPSPVTKIFRKQCFCFLIRELG